jgi:hypothetical protein
MHAAAAHQPLEHTASPISRSAKVRLAYVPEEQAYAIRNPGLALGRAMVEQVIQILKGATPAISAGDVATLEQWLSSRQEAPCPTQVRRCTEDGANYCSGSAPDSTSLAERMLTNWSTLGPH